MTELLLFLGSFAGIWLALWLVCALLLLLVYPLLSGSLQKWHPATSSRVLLLIVSFPFFVSLITTTLLFMPLAENSLVSIHCHENCQAHAPLFESIWLSSIGLMLILVVLFFILTKSALNVRTARQLMSHLSTLGKDVGSWHQLPDSRPVVFTLGWWRSRIFITEGLLRECDDRDVDIILQHELAHGRRLDNLRLLLARMFLLVLPTRFAEMLYSDLHFYTESSCDFEAAEVHGDLDVAETLLRVQRLMPREISYFDSGLVSAFTGAEVERRIKNLAAGSDQFSQGQAGQYICILALLLLSLMIVEPIHHGVELLLGLH